MDAIIEKLREHRNDHGPHGNEHNFFYRGWERDCIGLYDSIRCYNDLKQFILDERTNTKIFTIATIFPLIAGLLTEQQRTELVPILQESLSDNRMCEISYGRTNADDEDNSTVSESARFALNLLEKLATFH